MDGKKIDFQNKNNKEHHQLNNSISMTERIKKNKSGSKTIKKEMLLRKKMC